MRSVYVRMRFAGQRGTQQGILLTSGCRHSDSIQPRDQGWRTLWAKLFNIRISVYSILHEGDLSKQTGHVGSSERSISSESRETSL